MVSVIIIAHNEASHIEECLRAVQKQSRKPDEILLVVHNSTDNTAELAKKFEGVKIEVLETKERGPIFPRIRGFELAKGEYIACLDGDTIAEKDWLEKIIAPLESDTKIAGVGGMIWFNGSLGGNLAALFFFILSPFVIPGWHFYFWGANFALKKSAYEDCGGLAPFVEIKPKLGLTRWAEDCYLSLALEKSWKVVFEKRAKVKTYPNISDIHTPISKRTLDQTLDKSKLFRYFNI